MLQLHLSERAALALAWGAFLAAIALVCVAVSLDDLRSEATDLRDQLDALRTMLRLQRYTRPAVVVVRPAGAEIPQPAKELEDETLPG